MNKLKSFVVLLVLLSLAFVGYTQGQKIGKVTSSKLTEISGITAYSFQEGFFWVHNDSGDKAQIYLIDSLGNLKNTIVLSGLKLVDCEDIARVIVDNKSYLLLADIGNNVKNRAKVTIYMIPEPIIDFSTKETIIAKDDIKQVNYEYADKRRDAEAIFVNPQNKEVFIVSKRDFHATVFSFPISAFDKDEDLMLLPKMTLPFTFVTAADMSLDGKYILIKNISNIFMWECKEGESVLATLSKPYKLQPYEIEPQGEAICFDINKRYFYTVSERPLGLDSYLYKYIY